MPNPLPLNIGAGVWKEAGHVDQELLNTISSATFGSFTSTFNKGNRELPTTQTELFDADDMVSINAKSLPNEGLNHFLDKELATIVKMFSGKQAKIRISLAPRKAGELATMLDTLHRYDAAAVVNCIEINAACPNHRHGGDLQSVLAHDAEAVNSLLKEASIYTGWKALKIAPDTDIGTLQRIVQYCAVYSVGEIVSHNTRLVTAEYKTQKLGLPKGGMGGSLLLTSACSQLEQLRQQIQAQSANIKLVGCGGITDAASAQQHQDAGAVEGQMATVPYFLGSKAVQEIVQEQYS